MAESEKKIQTLMASVFSLNDRTDLKSIKTDAKQYRYQWAQ
ncbi:MAG: hypothetical protein PHS16_00900 [Candidatus Colwellbacteria bacterium]|nr:hypothetical protein [Candidatus Colwellbacteria bacterium]